MKHRKIRMPRRSLVKLQLQSLGAFCLCFTSPQERYRRYLLPVCMVCKKEKYSTANVLPVSSPINTHTQVDYALPYYTLTLLR